MGPIPSGEPLYSCCCRAAHGWDRALAPYDGTVLVMRMLCQCNLSHTWYRERMIINGSDIIPLSCKTRSLSGRNADRGGHIPAQPRILPIRRDGDNIGNIALLVLAD